MADCKACGAWFGSVTEQDLCPACERALKRLNGYAVHVVICRDCKYKDDCFSQIGHWSRDNVLELNNYEYHKIDFCSYGEPKEDNNG